METGEGGAGAANSAAPVPNAAVEKNRVRAVMSPDKLELVCNTLLNPDNMKQFGFMLGVTKTVRAKPKSGDIVKEFCKFLNDSQRVKDAGWFVGDDAMNSWIKEIRKLAAEAQKRKDENAAKGHPNGAFQEQSHVEAARELMEYFRDYEKLQEKNPQNRYNTPPSEVIEQIGADACQPQKLTGASLEDDGETMQQVAMERVAIGQQETSSKEKAY